MKKLLLVLAVVTAAVSMNAQSIGIHAGLNFAGGQFDDGFQEEDLEGITGIRIGPIVQFPLGTVFEFHTGAIYSQKGYEDTNSISVEFGKTTIDYIEIPLAFAAGFDLGGIGAFVKAGPVLGVAIGGKQNLIAGPIDLQFGSDGEWKVLDTGATIGAGIKLGTLQIDASYDLSLSDIKNDDSGYRNKVFHVGLSFVVGK